MILYHGSFLEIAQPDLVHSRPNVDFGRGFYVRLRNGVGNSNAEEKTVLFQNMNMMRAGKRN